MTSKRVFLNSTTATDLLLASIDYNKNSKNCTPDDIQIELNPESGLKVKDIKFESEGDDSWANIRVTFYSAKPVYGAEIRYIVNNTFIYDHKTNSYKEDWIKVRITLTDQILLSASNNLITPADNDEEICQIVSYNNNFMSKNNSTEAYNVWNYSNSNKNSFILDLGNSPYISDFIIIDKGELTGDKNDNLSSIKVSLSNDKIKWNDYFINDKSNFKHFHIQRKQARYVKLSIDQNDKIENGYIALFQIYGQGQTPNITNHIKGIKPSLNDKNYTDNAEEWKVEKSNTHIFEFESIQTIDQIDFFEYRNFMQSVGFPPIIDLKVEISLDKKKWRTISKQKSSNCFKRIGLSSPENVKYIRTTSYQKTPNVYPGPSSSYWALTELRVFGTDTNTKKHTLFSATTEQNEKINIYPNPASNFIEINGENIESSINIYNILGAKVKTIYDYHSGEKINIEDLKQGIYLIPVNKKVYKVIKN
ncbi:T9SS type A sorting domain-containing protein [Halosquirtibacter laminarini]|uniref:T9SS type A sorting domain-containing protein n=1 Tax=Halosquirtibacter laminarini TaxID=3374600 RepID=A0AC61ND93_9BACT|nr:T9SS type A sorting domain-containing protein [Prolixibacteraceae bacterium]